jgi:hypothetical protein
LPPPLLLAPLPLLVAPLLAPLVPLLVPVPPLLLAPKPLSAPKPPSPDGLFFVDDWLPQAAATSVATASEMQVLR